MLSRIIACLDVDEGRVVKGTSFRDLKDAGDPVGLSGRYYRDGIDEIVFLDITAGTSGRRTAAGVLRKVAGSVFVPLCAGGGVASTEDARLLLLSGCDKVAVNSAAVRNPRLISQISGMFGSQCVVLSVDVRRAGTLYSVMVDAGTRDSGRELGDWLEEVQELGAGEILLTSVDRDGTQDGFDLELLETASSRCRVPLIASGGLGVPGDALSAFRAGADAVLGASVFHTGRLDVGMLKKYLADNGIEVRAC
jgi:cyclase